MGVQADQELQAAVDLRTWDESCYEFAHFTDDEARPRRSEASGATWG